jgi:hypothetical protein
MNPNYLHEFNPARHGRCKTIVSGRICGMDQHHLPHVRASEIKLNLPFQEFTASIDEEYYGYIAVRIPDGDATEEARQFIEDAIREKLESL